MSKKLYKVGDRNIKAQGQFYIDHVTAMTDESLHDKGDIAAELAHRDEKIKALRDYIAMKEKEKTNDS